MISPRHAQVLILGLAVALAGCGGGGSADSEAIGSASANAVTSVEPPTQTTEDPNAVTLEEQESLVEFAAPDVADTVSIQAKAGRTALLSGENFLSDLQWVSVRNDFGPVELDQSVGNAAANDGNRPMQINGVQYQKGLGVHGNSGVVYALNAQCTRFQTVLGINDFKGSTAINSRGSVIYEVWADGASLYTSKVITGATAGTLVQLDVSGARELKLITKNNGAAGDPRASDYDHANWADARVTCTGAATPAWTFCANEYGTCNFSGTRQVRYGANAQYIVKTLTAQNGGIACNNTTFGSDPVPNIAKRCEIDGTDSPVMVPTIRSFTASQAAVTAGARVTLNWGIDNATSVSIDNGVGTVTGTSVVVTPAATTTYILTARNAAGSVTRSTTITVSAAPPAGTVPSITSFSAAPTAINVGSPATLSWSVGNATSISIAPGIGAVTGTSRSVSPTQTTTYTLTATNSTGTSTRQAIVTVSTPPPTNVTWTRCANEYGYCYFEGMRDVRFRTADGRAVTREFFQDARCAGDALGFNADPAPGVGGKYCEYGPVKLTTLNPPDHSGMGPYIDLTKIPRGAPGFNNVRVRANPEAPSRSKEKGAFRTVCTLSHMNFDDPLVYPGNPGAAHLHAFFGNTLTNAHTTAESLATTGSGTCRGGIANRSAYWVPAMVDTRDGSVVVPFEGHFYYKNGYGNIPPQDIRPLPKGLRMIAGTATSTGQQPNTAWGCLEGQALSSAPPGSIPSCSAPSYLQMTIVFPQCWDGRNLDSADHKSHMAFKQNLVCPASHPVAIPEITFNIRYKVNVAGETARWRLSSDMYDASKPGGYSSHGDWWDGWQDEIKNAFVRGCNQQAVDCHSNLLGDGREIF